jgi:hypothetical protein
MKTIFKKKIMTPKEKAEELLKQMDVIHYMKLGGKNSESKGLPVSMHNSQIKQCALIAVNEILKITWVDKFLIVDEFWNEVKEEINKL